MAFRKFIEGHIAVLPGENFDPKEGRNGVFFDSKVLEETLETKNVPQGIRIQKIKVPKEAILREDKTRFAYKANQKVKLLS